jgi:hypothetical protein
MKSQPYNPSTSLTRRKFVVAMDDHLELETGPAGQSR